MRHTPEERRVIAESAEKQMRQWILRGEIWNRLQDEKEHPRIEDLLHPYITVSREAGAGGGEVAARVAETLGIRVLGREMLDYLAETYKLPRDMLEFVDEKTAHWIHASFGFWLDSHTVSQEQYVICLGRMVLLAAQQEPCVFIGRGAQFLLPKEKGLKVRIIASEKSRIERTMKMRGVSFDEARLFVNETDRGRTEFVRRYFHQDVSNPHLYDLVLNVDQLTLDRAVEAIVHEYQQVFGPVST